MTLLFQCLCIVLTAEVFVLGAYFEPKPLTCSVPQGSILGAGLYSDYTQPLGLLIVTLLLLYHLYADDCQVFKSFNPRKPDEQDDTASDIENGIACINSWTSNNRLCLNPDKTEFIAFSSTYYLQRVHVDSLSLQGSTVPRSPIVRNLGVYMDYSLSLDAHISHLCKVCFYNLGWIRKIRNYLTPETTKTIVHAMVISRLDYCNSLSSIYPRPQLIACNGL